MKLAKLLALGSVAFMVCGISLADASGSTPANPSAPTTSTSSATNSSDVGPN